jgi:hypothetical protein
LSFHFENVTYESLDDIAYLGHVRPSYTGSGTSWAKHSSVGSSIASGMAAAISTGHPMSNWRDEMDAYP